MHARTKIRSGWGWRGLAAVMLAASAAMSPGCASNPGDGYSFSSTFPTDVQTIALPMFENQTFVQGIEGELAMAIASEVRRSTPWKVVNSGSADAELKGSIVSANIQTLSLGRNTGLSEDVAYIVSVDFELRDRRSGKVLTARRSFSASESFVPARGVGERQEVGRRAAVGKLARDLVNELRSGW